MRRRHFIGMIFGWALWLTLIATEAAYAASISSIPKAMRGIADPVLTVVGLAAWPVALGGWFNSGEGPHLSVPLNVAVGLIIWGTLGVVAAIYARRKPILSR